MKFSILKSFPCMSLALLAYFKSRFSICGSKKEKQKAIGTGLLFGTIGDLVIGYFDEQQFGLAMGAVLFGIGHLFCLRSYVGEMKSISRVLIFSITSYTLLVFYNFMLPLSIVTSIYAIYSFILCVCFVVSGSLFLEGTDMKACEDKENQCGRFGTFCRRFLGYILFLISDSLILLASKDYFEGCNTELLTLPVYFASQYLISSA